MQLTPVPAGLRITQCPPRVAKGARKARGGSGGGAQPTSAIVATASRKALLAYAATSRINR